MTRKQKIAQGIITVEGNNVKAAKKTTGKEKTTTRKKATKTKKTPVQQPTPPR